MPRRTRSGSSSRAAGSRDSREAAPSPTPATPGEPGVTWHKEGVGQAGQEAALHTACLAAGQLGLWGALGPRKALAGL